MAINKSSNQNVQIIESYGVSGMKLKLNLAQCQKFSSIYKKIEQKHPMDRTDLENEIFGFTAIFSEIQTPDSVDVWSSLHENSDEPKVLGKVRLD